MFKLIKVKQHMSLPRQHDYKTRNGTKNHSEKQVCNYVYLCSCDELALRAKIRRVKGVCLNLVLANKSIMYSSF